MIPPQFPKKIAKYSKKALSMNLEEELSNHIEEIINVIMAEYDIELVDVVTNKESRSNPLYYREEFLEELNNFDYLEVNENNVTLIIPDMDNFVFRGRLKVIEGILNGTAGTYIEVDGQQYEQLFNKKPINLDPLDVSVPKKERIYLVRRTPKIVRQWRDTFPSTKMVEFPFSNVPPIRIFDAANDYVDDNIDDWMDKAIEKFKKDFSFNALQKIMV